MKTTYGYLSWSDGALQRSLALRQVGVSFQHPGQGGAVPVEMGLLIRRVEEPALREEKTLTLTQVYLHWCRVKKSPVNLSSIDDLSKTRTMPVKGDSGSRAWRPTLSMKVNDMILNCGQSRKSWLLPDLRPRSCTLHWCEAGRTAETRSAWTTVASLSGCCLRRNTEFLLRREAAFDNQLSWADQPTS